MQDASTLTMSTAALDGRTLLGATSCYRVMWKQIGWECRFAEQQFFDSHPRSSMRMIGKLGWSALVLYRTFRSRIVHLRKPA
jgi:hypothetical protein